MLVISLGLNLALAAVIMILLFQLQKAKKRIGHDQKTKVLWFWHVAPKIAQLVKRASRGGQKIAVAMLDLDGFKQVNDTYGHQRGDRLLRELCQVILATIRPLDVLTRFGGEEFLLAFILDDGVEGAEAAAEKVRSAVAGHTFDSDLHLTVSVGLAVCPTDGSTLDDLVRGADQAMYHAKEQGKNRVVSGLIRKLPP